MQPATAQELDDFETDVLAGFVLARASAGVNDDTVRGDVSHLEQLRDWFERPPWEMEPADADRRFGKVLRSAAPAIRAARAEALDLFFHYLELRYKTEIYHLTGRVVECPLDEMNPPRARVDVRKLPYWGSSTHVYPRSMSQAVNAATISASVAQSTLQR